MDVAIAILTLALVIITAFYAWQTRLTVEEMRKARLELDENRRRDKSDAAARRALDAVRELQQTIRLRGASGLDRNDIWLLSQALDAEALLIADEDVASKVRVCSLLAYTASWPDDVLVKEAVASAGLVRLRLQGAVDAVRWTLEDYLREREFNAERWTDLPNQANAQAWILQAERDGGSS